MVFDDPILPPGTPPPPVTPPPPTPDFSASIPLDLTANVLSLLVNPTQFNFSGDVLNSIGVAGGTSYPSLEIEPGAGSNAELTFRNNTSDVFFTLEGDPSAQLFSINSGTNNFQIIQNGAAKILIEDTKSSFLSDLTLAIPLEDVILTWDNNTAFGDVTQTLFGGDTLFALNVGNLRYNIVRGGTARFEINEFDTRVRENLVVEELGATSIFVSLVNSNGSASIGFDSFGANMTFNNSSANYIFSSPVTTNTNITLSNTTFTSSIELNDLGELRLNSNTLPLTVTCADLSVTTPTVNWSVSTGASLNRLDGTPATMDLISGASSSQIAYADSTKRLTFNGAQSYGFASGIVGVAYTTGVIVTRSIVSGATEQILASDLGLGVGDVFSIVAYAVQNDAPGTSIPNAGGAFSRAEMYIYPSGVATLSNANVSFALGFSGTNVGGIPVIEFSHTGIVQQTFQFHASVFQRYDTTIEEIVPPPGP